MYKVEVYFSGKYSAYHSKSFATKAEAIAYKKYFDEWWPMLTKTLLIY